MGRYRWGPLGPGPPWETAAFILQLCPPLGGERHPSRGFRSVSVSSLLFWQREWRARSQGRGRGVSIGRVQGSGPGTRVHDRARLGPTFCSNRMSS